MALALTCAAFSQVSSTPVHNFGEQSFHIVLFEDGSGYVSPIANSDIRWNFGCSIDGMTDRLQCHVRYSGWDKGRPYVIYSGRGEPQGLCIDGHDFPGTYAMGRVDRNEAMRSELSGCIYGEEILEQVRTGYSFLARYYEWPYQGYEEQTTKLIGLAKAMNVLDRVVKGSFENVRIR